MRRTITLGIVLLLSMVLPAPVLYGEGNPPANGPLADLQSQLNDIKEDLHDGKYGQIVVVTRRARAFVSADATYGYDYVTTISDGQEGVLQHTDCTLFGADTGISTGNRVYLQRSGEEVQFNLCNSIGTVDLEPGDEIVYECEAFGDHPRSYCQIEVTLWMTLRNI